MLKQSQYEEIDWDNRAENLTNAIKCKLNTPL